MDKNTLFIALLRFHISINILNNNKFIYYRMVVTGEREELTLNFYSIEDAILFTENDIANCHNIQEVIAIYDEKYDKKDFVIPFPEENLLSRKIKR